MCTDPAKGMAEEQNNAFSYNSITEEPASLVNVKVLDPDVAWHCRFVPDKTVKLWKVSERDRRPEGYNLKDDSGLMRDPTSITTLRVPVFKPMELMVEASPRRVFANAHTYHINSISVNSDQETYMSADDLRINLWHLEITDQSFSILFMVVVLSCTISWKVGVKFRQFRGQFII